MTRSPGVLARYPSPLRYPGGKGKVANFIKLLVIENRLQGARYVEPYAGGASVALSLLFEDYVDSVQINDLNRGVYSFWCLATEQPDDLCSRLRAVTLTVEEWRRQRAIYADSSASPGDLGFATLYLNRTNRSGIIARGGVIGGVRQQGTWRMDARFDAQALCDRIQKVARFAPRIEVSNIDAAELIRQVGDADFRQFLYLDPPYYIKGSRLYDNFYTHADHVAVRDALRSPTGACVVTYDAVPQILDLYAGWTSREYALGYSASSVSSGAEVMFLSAGLNWPDGNVSPSGITSRLVDSALSGMAHSSADELR